MEKGKRILLTLLFVILAAMGIMAGTFLAGGGLKPRPGVDRGERETAQAYPEPSEGQTAGAEAGQEIKDSQEIKNGQETKTSIRLETAAEETEMETDADVPEEAGGESGEPCTLLFAGDVYLSEHVLGAYSRAGNITGVLDQGILKETLGADIFMVNQEFPFTDRGTKAADKQFTFRLPPMVSPRSHEGDVKAILDSLTELEKVAEETGTYIYLEPLNRYQDHTGRGSAMWGQEKTGTRRSAWRSWRSMENGSGSWGRPGSICPLTGRRDRTIPVGFPPMIRPGPWRP